MTYSVRTLRMVNAAPDYYAYSKLFADLQQAIADDLDAADVNMVDVQQQLYISTATWGLRYWEQILHIPTVPADGYALRRSRVLAAWRGVGNFSVAMLYKTIEAYTTTQVNITVDVNDSLVTIEVYNDAKSLLLALPQIDNIIHAHIGMALRLIQQADVQLVYGQANRLGGIKTAGLPLPTGDALAYSLGRAVRRGGYITLYQSRPPGGENLLVFGAFVRTGGILTAK